MLQATTPPPSSSCRAPATPPTPKHGWDDDYQPFSPRKSARLSSQRSRITETPPRSFQARSTRPANPSSSLTSPPTARKRSFRKMASDFGGKAVSGALDEDSTVAAAAALGLSGRNHGKTDLDMASITTHTRASGMLPTPAKTPRKDTAGIPAEVTAIARNLFPHQAGSADALMSNPRRKNMKKSSGFSLEGFEADAPSTPIAIFTDSHERIPEVDKSDDNPFYDGAKVQREPTKRKGKGKQTMIAIPGEEAQIAEEHRDGMTYMFRGKRIMRLWEEEKISDEEYTGDIGAGLEESLPASFRPGLPRSEMQPKLLFVEEMQAKYDKTKAAGTYDDEEAVTDIEDLHDAVSTPKNTKVLLSTPEAPRFGPVSPPMTTRGTRSSKKDLSTQAEQSPTRQGRREKVSPFDSWSRTKSVADPSKKREGSPVRRNAKRVRKTSPVSK